MDLYKKMAGTAAVFVRACLHANSPVERDGLIWSDSELHLDSLDKNQLIRKEPMATSLALEGLEIYDPPTHGDLRQVTRLGSHFVYIAAIKGWVEYHPAS